jgi:DNA-binding transcriptional ArsR family regulator
MDLIDKPLWNELEKSIHEPARLALVTTLCASPEGLGFQELKHQCGLTDGNLSRHLKVLEEAGIICLQKAGKGRGSHTRVTMTREGREAFLKYLHSLEQVLHGALQSLDLESSTSTAGLSLALS